MVEKKLGENLRKARKERKLTQKQVAEILDISTDYVSRIEKGERTPRDRILFDIVDFIEGKTNDRSNLGLLEMTEAAVRETSVDAPHITETEIQVYLGTISGVEAWTS
jgi:transcriptional regulator with XRE-family HTH domain